MKLILKNQHGEYSVDQDAETLAEVVRLFEQLLKAAGFEFTGQLDFQDD